MAQCLTFRRVQFERYIFKLSANKEPANRFYREDQPVERPSIAAIDETHGTTTVVGDDSWLINRPFISP